MARLSHWSNLDFSRGVVLRLVCPCVARTRRCLSEVQRASTPDANHNVHSLHPCTRPAASSASAGVGKGSARSCKHDVEPVEPGSRTRSRIPLDLKNVRPVTRKIFSSIRQHALHALRIWQLVEGVSSVNDYACRYFSRRMRETKLSAKTLASSAFLWICGQSHSTTRSPALTLLRPQGYNAAVESTVIEGQGGK